MTNINRRTLLSALFALPLAWLPKRVATKPQELPPLEGTAIDPSIMKRVREADVAQPCLLYPAVFEISPHAFQASRPYERIVWEPVAAHIACIPPCEPPYVELKPIDVCDPLCQRPHWCIDGQDEKFYFVSSFDEAFSFRYENGKVLANEAWVRSKLALLYPNQFSA